MNRSASAVVPAILLLGTLAAGQEFHRVRQSYALPAEDFLSLFIDAYGADVKLASGPAGMVEATFHIPDTLHPPVFGIWPMADSGDRHSLSFYRPEDGPGAVKGELWEITVPRDIDFVSILHAGFADIALWEVDEMMVSTDADSANIVMDLSSLESGKLTLTADATTGDVLLYVPRTARVGVVAECTLGLLKAPGFTELDLDEYADPENDFRFRETQQGREYVPETGAGAEVNLIATADRGNIDVILTGGDD